MEINYLSSSKPEFICELCGSPINDEVKLAAKNYTPPQNIQDRSYGSNQYSVAQAPTPKSQNTPFPRPTISAIPAPPEFIKNSINSTPSIQSQHPPINGALLLFPQINKRINIEPNEDVFYFGRNTILPLVSPQDYDVEWLNSISRVRKDNFNRIVHQHFLLRKDSSGHFTIEDNRSRWGTWVNRQQIKGRGPIPLMNGDKIELMLSKPGTKQIVPFEILFYC